MNWNKPVFNNYGGQNKNGKPYQAMGNRGNKEGTKDETVFMENYVNDFDAEKLAESLSFKAFEVYKECFRSIKSNSALRKVYNSYIDNKDSDIKVQIWFAKVGYQEKRELLPIGFLRFLEGIYKKLEKKENRNEIFKQFLEVFVAYHKYFADNK